MPNFSTKGIKQEKGINQDKQMSLFDNTGPLPYRIRPNTIEDLIGQRHLISDSGILTKWLKSNLPFSIILWGPPGCGKTTIAFIAKSNTDKDFIYVSGASTSISELREVISKSNTFRGRVVLFIDEIHRLAKNQQDVLLESLESGNLILIGTTTENPHVSITRALHSRVKVIELKPHSQEDLKNIVNRALSHPKGYKGITIDEAAIQKLVNSASGDVRRLLFNLEECAEEVKRLNETIINANVVEKILKDSQLQIGSDPDSHYHYVSALQKSIRGSDPNAALYWLARLLAGGADPIHVARRILVTASEDIGLADNNALQVAINAYQAASFLGMPEARIPLAQAVIYLSNSPKSNTTITSIDKAMKDATELTPYQVPFHIRNVGGEGYKYPHSYKDAKVEQEYLPKELSNKKYFEPNERDKI